MANIDDLFPSNYVRSEDLKGRRHKLIMDRLATEDVGDDHNKPVLYFKGAQKGLVLNKTNAMLIADAYGKDTGKWHGKLIELYVTRVNYQGRMVDGIRADIPTEETAKLEQAKSEPESGGAFAKDMNDDIPFRAEFR